MAPSTSDVYSAPSRQDWRGIAAEVGIGPPVFIAPGFQWQSLEYYRGTSYNVYPMWQSVLTKAAQGVDPVPQEAVDKQGFLIVLGGNGEAVMPYFEKHFDIEPIREFDGHLTVYRLRPLSSSTTPSG